MAIGPNDPINTSDINEVRVGVLGRSVDDSDTHWTTGGPALGRNALSVSSGERMITRAINAMDIRLGVVGDGTDGFAGRFNEVIGDEAGPDQAAFDAIGKNLIQAVADLSSAGTAMPEPPDDGLIYGRSRAVDETTGTWERVSAEVGNADQVLLGAGLTVTQAVGGWPVGATINPTDTVWSVIQRLLNPRVAAVYIAPTLTLAGTMPLAREIGENITPTLTPNFQQQDGGPIEAYRLYRGGTGGTLIYDGPVAVAHTDATFQLTTNESYQSQVDYEEGPIKNDSEGNPDPVGRIEAGTVTSAAVTYVPQRRAFFGALSEATVPDNSAFVRSLSSNMLNPVNNTQLAVDIVPGNRGACFAYPATLREATTIIQQGLGLDVKAGFNHEIVSVEGANGFTAVNYHVYFLITEFPFTGNDQFRLSI